jgi:hypothetical protein
MYNAKSVTKSKYVHDLGFEPKKAQRHFSRFIELNVVIPEGATHTLRYVFNFDVLNPVE